MGGQNSVEMEALRVDVARWVKCAVCLPHCPTFRLKAEVPHGRGHHDQPGLRLPLTTGRGGPNNPGLRHLFVLLAERPDKILA